MAKTDDTQAPYTPVAIEEVEASVQRNLAKREARARVSSLLAPIVALWLINGWFGYENLRQTRLGRLTGSRNRERIASGRAAKNHRVALILFDRRPQARSTTANMEPKS